MSISFTGSYPAHTRIETGCLSLDLAVAGQDFQKNYLLGLPLKCGYHIYSKETGLGKTTLSVSLMGIIGAQLGKNLSISPVDTFDLANIESILTSQNYSGNVDIVLDVDSHSKTLKKLTKSFLAKDTCGALLDSAYACMSTAVDEGDPEDASMGRDAKMISTFVRQVYDATISAKEDKFFIVTNMLFPDLGGGRKGFGPPAMSTPRGKTLPGLTSIHMKLTQQYLKNKAIKSDVGRLVHGKIEKNNFGPTNKEFDVYMVGGIGIHVGLTAMFDCLKYGLAEEVKGAKIAIDGQVIASTRNLIDGWEDEEFYKPFVDLIAENKEEIISGKKKVVKEEKEDDDEQTSDELYKG